MITTTEKRKDGIALLLACSRINQIRNLANQNSSVTVAELAQRFQVTAETIRRDLKQLEEESGSYNIKGEMEASLEASRQKVRLARLFKIVYYAVDTLTALGIASTILLQLRIWIFP